MTIHPAIVAVKAIIAEINDKIETETAQNHTDAYSVGRIDGLKTALHLAHMQLAYLQGYYSQKQK